MGKHRLGPFRSARICDCGDHGFVGLTYGAVALFSPEDLGRVASANWSVLAKCKGGAYVRGRTPGKTVMLHRHIMAPKNHEVIDHINHDVLDNRRENLRACSQTENRQNSKPTQKTSRFKGVHLYENYWHASICTNSDRTYLGRFTSELEAAVAYDAAAKTLHGEYALVNFPEGRP